jgi:tetratricopeptide (TPR) repeat protein
MAAPNKSLTKPMTKEELRAPDEVEVKLSAFWQGLYDHRKLIFGGVAVLLVGGVVLWFSGRAKTSARTSLGDAMADALKPVGASTGEEPEWYAQLEKVPKPVHFADEKTRADAATASLDAFLKAHPSEAAAAPVALTVANLKLRKGDHAAALTEVEAWIGANASSSALPLAHDLKGRALLAAGKLDEAEATFSTAAGLVEGPLKAHLLLQVADLQNPAVHPGRGDATKALASYKAALALLPEPPKPTEPVLFAAPESGPRSVVQARMALLE